MDNLRYFAICFNTSVRYTISYNKDDNIPKHEPQQTNFEIICRQCLLSKRTLFPNCDIHYAILHRNPHIKYQNFGNMTTTSRKSLPQNILKVILRNALIIK